tara:strand:- start:1167 stop:1343 length:177 start_codon:yes stop_codon:yes gene_type:complete
MQTLNVIITIKKIKKMYLLKKGDDFIKWLDRWEKEEEHKLKGYLEEIKVFLEGDEWDK